MCHYGSPKMVEQAKYDHLSKAYEKLEAERDGLARLHNIAKGDCGTWYVRFDELRESADTLQAQVVKLSEALEPVTKLAKYQDLTNHEVLANIIDGAKAALKPKETT